MWRCVLLSKAYLATLWFVATHAQTPKLTGINWHAQENVLDEVAWLLAKGRGHMKGCHIDPIFDPATTFYIMTCERPVLDVILHPKGSNVFARNRSGFVHAWNYSDPVTVKVPMAKEPVFATLYACPAGIKTSKVNRNSCTRYHLDIVRKGDDESHLDNLGFEGSPSERLAPVFSPLTYEYKAKVSIGKKFYISAQSAEPAGVVGIEFVGDDSTGDHGGLQWQHGCTGHGGLTRGARWTITLKAVGEFRYKICAKAAALTGSTSYYITITCHPDYSALLAGIDVGKYQDKMTPTFGPRNPEYFVLVPKSVMRVPVTVTTEDAQAKITVQIDEKPVQAFRGVANVNVTMVNNENNTYMLKSTPHWTRTVAIGVTSSDDATLENYVVTVKQDVSKFSKLKNITPDDKTPCVLDPPFQDNITEYQCWWWWENVANGDEIKVGGMIPHMYEKECSECIILAPDVDVDKQYQLSYKALDEKRYPFEDGHAWERKFLYGEFHTVPFQVISADQFTSTTYYVTMRRDCPWWMATSFTRWLSHTATTIALAMAAVSGVTNVMALAKQVQFMSLTCEISGVPEVYSDFADSLKAFNFDAFDYFRPLLKFFGIPTAKDIENMKRNWIANLKKQLGIEHATLLLQYCEVPKIFHENVRLYQNALLERKPSHATALTGHMLEYKRRKAAKAAAAARKRAAAANKSAASEATNHSTKDKRRLLLSDQGAQSLRDVSTVQELGGYLIRRLAHALGEDSVAQFILDMTNDETSLDTNVQNAMAFLAHRNVDTSSMPKDEKVQIFGSLRGGTEKSFNTSGSLLDSINKDWISDALQNRRLTESAPARMLGGKSGWDEKLDFTQDELDDLIDDEFKRDTFKHNHTRKKKEKFLRDKWTVIECGDPKIEVVENALAFIHNVLALKALISTTTGTFLILSLLIFFFGGFYFLFWFFCMRKRQTRWRAAEPGPLILFFSDYALMAFSKASAKVAAMPKAIHVFSFHATRNATRIGCIVGIILYPVMFVGAIFFKLKSALNAHFLVWNWKFDKFTDPRCSNIKVLLKPDVPDWLEPVQKFLTMHVRECIPVLDADGNELQFDADHAAASSSSIAKKEAIEQSGDPNSYRRRKKKELDAELRRLEAEIQKKQDAKKNEQKKKELVRQKTALLQEEEYHKRHNAQIENAKLPTLFVINRDRSMEAGNASNAGNAGNARNAATNNNNSNDNDTSNNMSNNRAPGNNKVDYIQIFEQKMAAIKVNGKAVGKYKIVDKFGDDITKDDIDEDSLPCLVKMLEPGTVASPAWFSYLIDKKKEASGEEAADEIKETYCVKPLTAYTDEFVPQKNRTEIMKLDPEERFAMMQWVDESMRAERKYMKYCILRVVAVHGNLAPKEPMRDPSNGFFDDFLKVDKGTVYERPSDDNVDFAILGMPNVTDYAKPEQGFEPDKTVEGGKPKYQQRGHSATLVNFPAVPGKDDNPNTAEHHTFIENEIGQRLVYKGNDGWTGAGKYAPFKACFGVPGGGYGATCVWMEEPAEGWAKWQTANIMNFAPESEIRTKCWADKWQWLYFNELNPWNEDDDDEQSINVCGCYKIQKKDVFIWKEFSKWKLKKYGNRVPFRVIGDEKVEMRKWIYDTLLQLALLKLKLAWLADKHPKFYQPRDQAEILHTPFKAIWYGVMFAKPNTRFQHLMKNKGESRDELMNYALMKLEDTYGFEEEEPWMLSVDPSQENEIKIMFDSQVFWMKEGDETLKRLRAHNALVPRHGYHTCPQFSKRGEKRFGIKRYVLFKPDGSRATVTLNVQMKHVLPLMRYTDGFKCNVSQDLLDMPIREDLDLVIGKSKRHEEYNYIVERGTILLSIIVLAGNKKNGKACALLFLTTRTITWAMSWYQSYMGDWDEELHQATRKKMAEEGAVKKMRRAANTFFATEVFVKFLQCVVLSFLCFGQFGFPGPLCAVACICVCCTSMIVMNLGTAMKQLEKAIKGFQESITGMIKSARSFKNQALNFINGDNPFGYQFYAIEQRVQNEKTADSITLIVQELGIAFEGRPNIEAGLAPEEIRSRSLLKRVIPHVMDTDDKDRYRSPRDHARFEKDIASSLYVAVDIDQMMMRKGLPQVIATIQCVNHPSNKTCRAQFDSYITLFKRLPDGSRWDEAWDEIPEVKMEKATQMVGGWCNRVNSWLDHELGAVELENTATKRIRQNIHALLENEGTGSEKRSMYKFKLLDVEIPILKDPSCKVDSLEGKLGYVRVLYDYEDMGVVFPRDRVSSFGKFEKKQKASDDMIGSLRTRVSGLLNSSMGPEEDIKKIPQFDEAGTGSAWKDLLTSDDFKKSIETLNFECSWKDQGAYDGSKGSLKMEAWLIRDRGVLKKADLFGTVRADGKSPGYVKVSKQFMFPSDEFVKMARPSDKLVVKYQFGDKSSECHVKDFKMTVTYSAVNREEERDMYRLRFVHNEEAKPDADFEDRPGEEFNVCIPMGVTEVKLVVMVQNKRSEGWFEEMVAFTGRIDLVKMCPELQHFYNPRTLFPKNPKHSIAYCRWWFSGGKIEPHGGEMGKHAEEIAPPAPEGCFAILLQAMKNCCLCPFMALYRCCCKRRDVSIEERMKYVGFISCGVRKFTEEEQADDLHIVEACNDITSGESAMNIEKILRHRDRWLMLASFFGLQTSEDDLKFLRKFHKEMLSLESALTNETDIQVKKKMARDKGMRGEVGANNETYSRAVTRLKRQLDEREKELNDVKRLGVEAQRISDLVGYMMGPNIVHKLKGSGGCCNCFPTESDIPEMHPDDEDNKETPKEVQEFAFNMLGRLRKHQMEKMQSGKQVLHYVIISDQLKISRMWRPDAIMPHVAKVTTRDFEDIDSKTVKFIVDFKVKPAGGWDDELHRVTSNKSLGTDGDIEFEKEVHISGSPMLVHGRVSFRAKVKAVIEKNGRIDFVGERGNVVLFLYWDGMKRWVISPHKGDPPPYGLNVEEVKGFLWVADNVMTPNKIHKNWHSTSGIAAVPWTENKNIRILMQNSKPAVKKNFLERVSSEKVKHVAEQVSEKAETATQSFCSELANLLRYEAGYAHDSEQRDCLVSLNTSYIQIAWKDDSIERLGPFRTFIMNEFGSYNQAWYHMTKTKNFRKNVGHRNLKTMLLESYNAINRDKEHQMMARREAEEAEKERLDEEAKRNQQAPELQQSKTLMSQLSKGFSSQQSKSFSRESNNNDTQVRTSTRSSTGSNSALKKKKTATRMLHRASTTDTGTMSQMNKDEGIAEVFAGSTLERSGTRANLVDDDDLDSLLTYLDRKRRTNVSPGDEFDELAALILDALDTDSSTQVVMTQLAKEVAKGETKIKVQQEGHFLPGDKVVLDPENDKRREENEIQGFESKMLVLRSPTKFPHSDNSIIRTAPRQGSKQASDGMISVGEVTDLYEVMPIVIGNIPINQEGQEHELGHFFDKLLGDIMDLTQYRPHILKTTVKSGEDTCYGLLNLPVAWQAQRAVDELARNSRKFFRGDFDGYEECFGCVPIVLADSEKLAEVAKQMKDNWNSPELNVAKPENWRFALADVEVKTEFDEMDKDQLAGHMHHRILWFSDPDEAEALQDTQNQAILGELEEFREWVLRHPWYRDIDAFWGELSDGLEVNRAEFTTAMSQVLMSFEQKNAVGEHAVIGVSRFKDDIAKDVDENHVRLLSANWEVQRDMQETPTTSPRAMDLDEKDLQASHQRRNLLCKFYVMGKQPFETEGFGNASRFTDIDNWAISVEGLTKMVTPTEAPVIEHGKAPELGLEITLRYDGKSVGENGLPDEKMFFQFCRRNISVSQERCAWTEVPFHAKDPSSPETKAHKIFADLDTAMSNGISRKELIPSSGESLEAAKQSLLKFHVPLAQIQEMRFEEDPKKGVPGHHTEMKIIRIKVNRQFANQEDWRTLKRALNPEWICENPDEEEVVFCCLPEYWTLWVNVIKDCQMGQAQEWVKFYDGGYLQHDQLRGLYMRHGYGIQRWPNGQVYVGGWCKHVYHDEGTLWGSIDDWRGGTSGIKPIPIYTGKHKNGNRSGLGTLTWEQDLMDRERQHETALRRARPTVKKCYHGDFKDGLFRGKGKLLVTGAVSQMLPVAASKGRLKRVPFPQVHPATLISFDGLFRSDFNQVYKEMVDQNLDPQFVDTFAFNKSALEAGNFGKDLKLKPEHAGDFPQVEPGTAQEAADPVFRSNLELDLLRPSRGDGSRKEIHYFELTGSKDVAQKAGVPLPDLGLAYYSKRVGGIPLDTKHLSEGTARYQDGTIYIGQFENSVPNGYGKCQQFDDSSNEPVATYKGDWSEGVRQHVTGPDGPGAEFNVPMNFQYVGGFIQNLRSGPRGIQRVHPDLYDMFGYSVYDGGWMTDKRHGFGKMIVPSGRPPAIGTQPTGTGTQPVAGSTPKSGAAGAGTGLDAGEPTTPQSPKRDRAASGGTASQPNLKDRSISGESPKARGMSAGTSASAPKPDGFAFYEPNMALTEQRLEPGDYIYEGEFKDGMRDGWGILSKAALIKEAVLVNDVYRGYWANDYLMGAGSDIPAFAFCGRFIYYGKFTAEGDRSGYGIIYDIAAYDDPAFLDCFSMRHDHLSDPPSDSKPFREKLRAKSLFTGTADDPDQYKVYEGLFERDVPHDFTGKAKEWIYKVQWEHKDDEENKTWTYVREGETAKLMAKYEGTFHGGRRHGRGTWKGKDMKGKEWTYSALVGKTAHNWQADKMHGIAVVEDAGHVTENVIFTNNESQMPLDTGAVFAKSHARLIDDTFSNVSLLLDTKEKPWELILKRQKTEARPADQLASHYESQAPLLRQPTDHDIPEEDVIVEGGNNENAEMNGLYFKMSGTFGLNIYKSTKIVKRQKKAASAFSFAPEEWEEVAISRFLYQDTKQECWIISDSPENDTPQKITVLGRSAAMVDDTSSHPGAIGKSWYVWHEDTSRIRAWKQDNQFADSEQVTVTCGVEKKRKLNPVDKIMIKPAMGLLLSETPASVSSYLLRHPTMFFQRPVYSSENGSQFMYWFRQGATVDKGYSEYTMVSPSEVATTDVVEDGYWIISSQVGLCNPENEQAAKSKTSGGFHSSVIAYIMSRSFTPDQILKDAGDDYWQVRDREGAAFKEVKKLAIKVDDHEDNHKTLATLDGEASSRRTPREPGSAR